MNDDTQITPAPAPSMPAVTDAELAARYAGEALAMGRYRLGIELARLAQRAADFEGTPAAARGAQAAAELFGAPAGSDRPAVAPAAPQGPPPVKTADGHHLCGFLLERNGSQRPCYQPIAYLNIGTLEDPSAGAWAHVDLSITDHPAMP